MARIDEVDYNGTKIVPLQFLKAVLPNPQDLGENYEGETSIGCRIRGIKDGKERTYYVYNNCSHQEAYKETGMQGVSYTTGVPAMIGAMMFFKGEWQRPGCKQRRKNLIRTRSWNSSISRDCLGMKCLIKIWNYNRTSQNEEYRR